MTIRVVSALITCYLAHPAVVQHTVQRLESAMTDLVLMEVRHPPGDVCCEGKPGSHSRWKLLKWWSLQAAPSPDRGLPEAPVEGDLLVQQDIVKTSLWAVLCYYGNIRHFNASTDELTQVWMIELPEHRQRGRVRDVFSWIKWKVFSLFLTWLA